MGQVITSSTVVSLAPDASVTDQAAALSVAFSQVVLEARELGGDEQDVVSVEIRDEGDGPPVTWRGGSNLTLTLETRLR